MPAEEKSPAGFRVWIYKEKVIGNQKSFSNLAEKHSGKNGRDLES